MTTEYDEGSYWGVLPGEVKYDAELSISAKYLYVILSSRARSNGYCWPSNNTLAKETMLSKRRVVELLGVLQERRYIKIVFERDETGQIERRRIYCGMFPDRVQGESEDAPCENSHHPHATDGSPPCEISHDPRAKNAFSYNCRKTKEEKQKEKQKGVSVADKKVSKYELDDEARELLNAYVGSDRQLADAMKDMIENRKELKAINSKRAIKSLLAELDRLSFGSRENKITLLRRATASNWKIVYPLKPNELPEQPANENGQASPGHLQEEAGVYYL